jgi:hypothetical protein
VRDSISIEFPVSDTALIEEFLEASLNWARQIRHTRLFEKTASPTLSERDEFILEQGDESLHFKKWIGDGQEAAGLRYARGDDAQGVIWTTECVMTLAPETSSVILRGSCLAQRPDATTHQPKKPQLVRLLLDAGLGGHDAEMQVRLTPHDLLTDDTDLHEDIRYGRAAHALPIILVSRGPQPHEARTLGDFARQLSGMAHVVTYPSVDFTARVAAMPGPLTPRGGAIARAAGQRHRQAVLHRPVAARLEGGFRGGRKRCHPLSQRLQPTPRDGLDRVARPSCARDAPNP